MLKHPSVYLCGCSWYVTLRPAAGSAMFTGPAAYVQFQERLLDLLLRHGAQLHAYALLADAVHLLLTPAQGARLAEFLAQLQVAGHADCVRLNSDSAVLRCYRYIDLYPQRVGVVADAAAWYFSSFGHNAHGVTDTLVTPHRCYLDLGRSCQARTQAYQRECSRSQRRPRLSGSQSLSAVAVDHRLAALAADAGQGNGPAGGRCRH